MENLTLIDEQPRTSAGEIGIVMLVKSGEATELIENGEESETVKVHFFEYVTKFFEPPMRVVWDADTMQAVLPADTANYLIKKGYARVMTKTEVRAYNKGLGKNGAEGSKTEKE